MEKEIDNENNINTCHCGNDCKCHEENKKNDKKNKSKEEISNLKNKVSELEDKLIYNQAELVNYRKRKDEEVSNLLKFANQDMIMEIIPILDNFERAIGMDDNNLTDDLSKFLEGFKMIYAHLVEILKKVGVSEIPAMGLVFNPSCHEALMVDCDNEKEDDIILEVFMKGYMLKDRVIRPSKVKVNKVN